MRGVLAKVGAESGTYKREPGIHKSDDASREMTGEAPHHLRARPCVAPRDALELRVDRVRRDQEQRHEDVARDPDERRHEDVARVADGP